MAHPHKYLLDEFEIAIKKLPPTLPEAEKEAKEKLKLMRADETLSEEAIVKVIADLGRQEYTHRHALSDLHAKFGEGIDKQQVIDHVEDVVAKKIGPLLESGVSLSELAQSDVFTEQLTAEQRYQVEDGIMLAQYKLEQEEKGFVKTHTDEFNAKVVDWEAHAKLVDDKIAELENLAGEDPKYKEEIEGQVETFKAGWSVVERDPTLKEVQGVVDYWKGVLSDEE